MNNLPITIIGTIQLALSEDIGFGDITTRYTVSPDKMMQGQLIARQAGVIAGLAVAQATFSQLNGAVQFSPCLNDGEPVETGQMLATIFGPAQAILSAERVALNFLQRMSGIASLTRRYVEAVKPHQAIILDTRKTVPGLRELDKLAVRLGGGQNHRHGLYDMAMIKENHIASAGGITPAVERFRAGDNNQHPLEVEVTTLDELREVLPLKVDRILLDNMSLAEMREAVAITAGQTPLEASGNVSLETVNAIAATGVNFISVGALTHSVQALDISLILKSKQVSR